MDALSEEISAFVSGRRRESAEARQRAALQLACGLELGDALSASGDGRARLAVRLQRAIERERLKGARGHWSYDLNRHIALKQVLDRLRAA